MNFKHTLRALRHRNYRLFFGGHGLSLIGTWMQHAAMQWLVYELTGSKALLGFVGFCQQLPVFLISSVGGVLADRWDQRRLLLVTQLLAMLQAVAVTVLVATGTVAERSDWPWLVLMASLLGTINAFDVPLRQSMVVRLVGGREDLSSAIAMNSMLVNGSRLVGPALAGVVISSGGALLASWGSRCVAGGIAAPPAWAGPYAGAGACFGLNAASYLGVLGALLAMRLPPVVPRPERRHVLHELREGAAYAWRVPHIRLVLTFLAGLSLLGISYGVLLPAFAKDVLGGGDSARAARIYGLLVGSMGAGALVANFFLASLRDSRRLGRVIAVAAVLFSLGLLALSHSRWLWLSLPLMLVLGMAHAGQLVAGNTLLQALVDDDKRGRVMGLHAMAFMGMMPFGQILAGSVAEHMGAPDTVLCFGLACLAGSAIFMIRLKAIERRERAAPGAAGAALPVALDAGPPPADGVPPEA
jgi:MFS family permease